MYLEVICPAVSMWLIYQCCKTEMRLRLDARPSPGVRRAASLICYGRWTLIGLASVVGMIAIQANQVLGVPGREVRKQDILAASAMLLLIVGSSLVFGAGLRASVENEPVHDSPKPTASSDPPTQPPA